MGINVDLKPKTYLVNLILGCLFFIFGSIAMTIMINKYLAQWRDFLSVFLVLTFLIVFGMFKLRQGAEEWNYFEKLEKEKMEMENKKLKLEINLLEKQIKSKK